METKIGLDPNELAILENYSITDWERFSKKCHPVIIALMKTLVSCNPGQRADIAQGFSKIENDNDRYMEMITHLASLSDDSYKKIATILEKFTD